MVDLRYENLRTSSAGVPSIVNSCSDDRESISVFLRLILRPNFLHASEKASRSAAGLEKRRTPQHRLPKESLLRPALEPWLWLEIWIVGRNCHHHA